MNPWKLVCVDCQAEHPSLEVRYRCDCGGTLDVVHDHKTSTAGLSLQDFDRRLGSLDPLDRSGVWRFRELILPLQARHVVTKPEGNTNLYQSQSLSAWVGLDRLWCKHEGENPTGSFKDRGMTVGVSAARALGMRKVACASTGNTSASMAAYAAAAGMDSFVFIPAGKIAYGKLSQALAHGARTVQIAGDFDAAMHLVEQVCQSQDIYLLNSINPFRIEGQKAIGFELLQDLNWQVPDWIVLPGGNLGNNTAIAKGLLELRALGWIDRLPRMAVIQANGANPLYKSFSTGQPFEPLAGAETIATAIRIGAPVSWKKSLRGIRALSGIVEQVSDQQIMDAKAQVDRAGIGAEPASCASLAGLKKLLEQKTIAPDQSAVCILTGHLLKDPDATVGYHKNELAGIAPQYANPPVQAAANLAELVKAIADC